MQSRDNTQAVTLAGNAIFAGSGAIYAVAASMLLVDNAKIESLTVIVADPTIDSNGAISRSAALRNAQSVAGAGCPASVEVVRDFLVLFERLFGPWRLF